MTTSIRTYAAPPLRAGEDRPEALRAERIGQEAKRRFEEDQNREREVRREGGGTGIEQLRAEVQELRQHIRKLAERLEQSERKR